MNDDGQSCPREAAYVKINSAQQVLDDLMNNIKKDISQPEGATDIVSSLKEQITTICDDVGVNISEAASSANCLNTLKEFEDGASKVGLIKVRNLESMMDPNRNRIDLSFLHGLTIELSDSDDEAIRNPAPPHKGKDLSKVLGNGKKIDPAPRHGRMTRLRATLAVKQESQANASTDSIYTRRSHLSRENRDSPATSEPDSTPGKSILKKSRSHRGRMDRKVQFSPRAAKVHTYVSATHDSSEESTDEETDSDGDAAPLSAFISKRVQIRIGSAKVKLSPSTVETLKKNRQFYRQCIVLVSAAERRACNNVNRDPGDDETRQNDRKRKRCDNSPIMDTTKRKHDDEQCALEADDRKDRKRQKKEDKRLRKEAKKLAKLQKRIQQTDGSQADNERSSISTHAMDSSTNYDDEVALSATSNANGTSESHAEDSNRNTPPQDCQDVGKTDQAEESTALKDSSTPPSDDDDDEQVSKRKKKKKTKFVLSDSEDSGCDKPNNIETVTIDDSENDSSDVGASKQRQRRVKGRSRIRKVADSSDEDEKTTRKQIRKLISRDSLSDSTKQAEREESERKKRIAERQQKYNNIFDPEALESAQLKKVVLDFNEETQEEILTVDERIVQHLKPHQGKGIQFMWNACFESIDRAKNTEGSGCILAHCMGLGKTLQVISLVHTLLSHEEKTGVKKVLIVCPLSTVLNWVSEFQQWLPDDDIVQVYNLVAYKQNRERACHVMDWHKYGGVLVLGYDMFRNLSNETNKRLSRKMRNDFKAALVDPGAQLVVCDEGHLLKNEKTSISKAMNNVLTMRRIVLTGTPLQNNLKEYWCMVQFVKMNLLGTFKEYLNRFVNPITNGQYTDSTPTDIQIMRKRSHVLHKLLDGVVQRRDYCVLAPFLPPKHEYVIFISLGETQINLYKHYMEHLAQRSGLGTRTSFLFTDFQELQRICTHPRVLLDKSIQNKIAQEKKDWENDDDSEGSLKDFIDDSDDESDAKSTSGGSDHNSDDESAKVQCRRRTRAMTEKEPEPVVQEQDKEQVSQEWWTSFTSGDELHNIVHSGKLSLLFEILHQCELIGDKVLVFSQSLLSLNVIEYFLARIDEAAQNGDHSMVNGYNSSWSLGLDYFRLDGSSSCDNRASWCSTFNDVNNTRARLFLISTRAGGLGINLVAANRVIIFDVSWNPSHDIQSIYRVYRFGQTKPSYIYRFVTMGTMEMKIYERQVTKQAISKRVIDEQQIDRHYNQTDLQELYKFDPKPCERPPPIPPKDILLGELLQNFSNHIFKYHEHQSLLENKEDEVLNEAERKAAWEEFENEKQQQKFSSGHINNIPMHTVVQALTNILKRDHPAFTAFEINGVMPQYLNALRGQMANNEMALYNRMLTEIRTMRAEEQAKLQEYYKQQRAIYLMQQQMQRQLSQADHSQLASSMNIPALQEYFNQFTHHLSRSGLDTMTAQPNRSNFPAENEIVNLDED